MVNNGACKGQDFEMNVCVVTRSFVNVTSCNTLHTALETRVGLHIHFFHLGSSCISFWHCRCVKSRFKSRSILTLVEVCHLMLAKGGGGSFWGMLQHKESNGKGQLNKH